MRLKVILFFVACLVSPFTWAVHPSFTLDEKPFTKGIPLQWRYTMQLPTPNKHVANSTSTLHYLLEQAISYAPNNRSATAGLIAAQAREKQAWIAAWRPQFNGFLSLSQTKQTYNEQKSDIPSSLASITGTWPLWRAAERAQIAAQSAFTLQSAWEKKQSEQEVALSISTAYLDGIEAYQLQLLTQSQLQALQEQLRINERRIEGGTGTVLDTLETRTRLGQLQSDLQTLDARLHNQNLLIERFSGVKTTWPRGLQTLVSPTLPLPLVVPDFARALRSLADASPQIKSAQAQRTAAQATNRAQKLDQQMPTVDLVGRSSRSKRSVQFNGQNEAQAITEHEIGVEVSWPIFTSGLQQQRINETSALLMQAQARLDEAESDVKTQLRIAYQTLAQTEKSIELEQQVLQTARMGFDAVQKAFLAGIRNNTDVLNAQTQIYEAQRRLVSTTTNLLITQINILALLGKLEARTVRPLTSVFNTALDNNTPI